MRVRKLTGCVNIVAECPTHGGQEAPLAGTSLARGLQLRDVLRHHFPLLVFLSACSSPSVPSATTPGDAGVGRDADVRSNCGEVLPPPSNCGSLSWSASETLSRPRNHQLSVVATSVMGSFLYAVGGADRSSVLDKVDRAPIAADGTLGEFEELATPLPVALGGMAGGLVGSTIVFVGGNGRAGNSDQSYAARIGADGLLSPWQPAGSIKHPRMHPGAVVFDNTFYVLGGFSDPDVWDDIVRAKVGPDGTVSEWVSAGKLPAPRSHFSATLLGRHVYIAGGIDKSALPVALATHASFFYGGYLYVGGGLGGPSYKVESRMWRAQVATDYALGTWEDAPPLPSGRGHVHQMPLLQNHVYFVAGALNHQLESSTEVDVGTFQ
jgi:hypothetical protein